MRMMKQKIEYIIGLLILTLGICLIVLADVGASPWDSVSLGFVEIYGFNLGQWTFIVGIILVMITSLIVNKPLRSDKISLIISILFFISLLISFIVATTSILFLIPLSLTLILYIILIFKNSLNIRYTSVIAGLLTGLFIEMWFNIFANYVPSGIITCLIGIVVLSLGIALYTRVDIAPNPVDNLMIGLVDGFDMSITKAKLITDAIGISIGILIGGPVGYGTFLIVIMAGPFVGLFTKFFNRINK